MRTLSTGETDAISAGQLNLLDVGYLWAGYHSLGMLPTALVGAGYGATLGLLSLFTIIEAPPIGLTLWSGVGLPTLLGTTVALVEYSIGSYGAYITQPSIS